MIAPPPDFGGRTPRGTALGGGEPIALTGDSASGGTALAPADSVVPANPPTRAAAESGSGQPGASGQTAGAAAASSGGSAGPATTGVGGTNATGGTGGSPGTNANASNDATGSTAAAAPASSQLQKRTVGQGVTTTGGSILGGGAGAPPGGPAGGGNSAGNSAAVGTPNFDVSTAEGLLAAAKYAVANGDPITGERLLSEYIDRFNYASNADEAYYLLAKLYEQNGKVRNIEKSLQYYSMLRSDFPLSSYWDEAGKQIQYLTRHFIYVR